MNTYEITTLVNVLATLGIGFTFRPLYDGYQVIGDGWDVIIHSASIGHEDGRLEGMGRPFWTDGDDVRGNLTARDVLKAIL